MKNLVNAREHINQVITEAEETKNYLVDVADLLLAVNDVVDVAFPTPNSDGHEGFWVPRTEWDAMNRAHERAW